MLQGLQPQARGTLAFGRDAVGFVSSLVYSGLSPTVPVLLSYAFCDVSKGKRYDKPGLASCLL